MSARFEIVRTDAAQPWHARFRAANGRILWTTENYARRRTAEKAIQTLAEDIEWTFDTSTENGGIITRLVDEREATK